MKLNVLGMGNNLKDKILINFLPALLIVFTFVIDRVSKIYAINALQSGDLFVNDFLNFSLVWNKGIGFGLLRLDNVFYHLISLLIVLIILFLIYLIIKSKILDKILLALVVGGALGNCYDRVTFLAVPDFIDFHYKNLHWFTFNFADIFITSGIIMIIFKEVFFKNEN